jgi:hypothetical protein
MRDFTIHAKPFEAGCEPADIWEGEEGAGRGGAKWTLQWSAAEGGVVGGGFGAACGAEAAALFWADFGSVRATAAPLDVSELREELREEVRVAGGKHAPHAWTEGNGALGSCCSGRGSSQHRSMHAIVCAGADHARRGDALAAEDHRRAYRQVGWDGRTRLCARAPHGAPRARPRR